MDRFELMVDKIKYDVYDLLAGLGGIGRSLHFSAGAFVLFFSRNIFMNHILGELFLVKKKISD